MRFSILCILLMLTVFVRAQTDLHKNVTFETIDDVPIQLDVAVPQGNGPFPLIVAFHGGAFRIGDKAKFTPMIETMAGHGYVAASVNYRFSPKYRWPAQFDDARAAVLFLKAHAAEYHIDVDRVGTTGESAGAQLAMLLGFEPDAPGSTSVTSTRARAVVNFYGPVDLSHWEVVPLIDFFWQKRFHESMADAMSDFLGTKDPDSPRIKAASPITYVDDSSPPVLTFHGTLDPMVPFHQAEELHAALRKCGVHERLVPIPNGLHGAWAQSVKADADQKALAFFDSYLKPGPIKNDPLEGGVSIGPKADKPTSVR